MNHTQLDVWKLSISLCLQIYSIVKKFPGEEQGILAYQIKKSSVSIPSNIAEGAGRKSSKEYIQFLYIAKGSLAELDTQLIISSSLGLIDSETFNELDNKITRIRSMLTRQIWSIKNRSSFKNQNESP